MNDAKRTRPRTSITDDIEQLWPQLEAGIRYLSRKSGEESDTVNSSPSVRTADLVRVQINGRWVSVHRHWYTSYPWKVYGDEGRKPRAVMGGSGK